MRLAAEDRESVLLIIAVPVRRNSVLPTAAAWEKAGYNERKVCFNTSILDH